MQERQVKVKPGGRISCTGHLHMTQVAGPGTERCRLPNLLGEHVFNHQLRVLRPSQTFLCVSGIREVATQSHSGLYKLTGILSPRGGAPLEPGFRQIELSLESCKMNMEGPKQRVSDWLP